MTIFDVRIMVWDRSGCSKNVPVRLDWCMASVQLMCLPWAERQRSEYYVTHSKTMCLDTHIHILYHQKCAHLESGNCMCLAYVLVTDIYDRSNHFTRWCWETSIATSCNHFARDFGASLPNRPYRKWKEELLLFTLIQGLIPGRTY